MPKLRYRLVMVNSKKFPDVTPFSVAFGAALGKVMTTRGVSAAATARAIHKKAGASYVSERLRGLRACDTDVIAGVAIVAGTDPRTIVREVLAEMRRVQVQVVTESKVVAPPSKRASGPRR